MIIGIAGVGAVGSAVKYGMEKLGHTVVPHDPKLNTKIEDILRTEICFISVPTPSNEDGSCNTGIVKNVVEELQKHNYSGIIAIKSTVEPETTQKLIDHYNNPLICFVPEFLRERCATTDFMENHDICIIGTNNDYVYNMLVKAHGRYPKKFFQLSPTEAELCKYFNNNYNATLVTFANSFYEVAKACNADYSKIKNVMVNREHIFDRYLDCNENFRGYGGMCVTPETLVSTNNGDIPIKDIKIGDMVVTCHGRLRKVTNVFKRNINEHIMNITPDGKSTIRITENHLFFKKNLETFKEHWVSAANLELGEMLIAPTPPNIISDILDRKLKIGDITIKNLDNNVDMYTGISEEDILLDNMDIPEMEVEHKIVSITHEQYSGDVYNLEVEEDESYLVYGIAVHNCLPKDMKAINAVVNYKQIPVKFFNTIIEENDKYKVTVFDGMRP